VKARPEPAEFAPTWSLHPGALLRQVLQKQDVRQSEIAERTGLSAKHVNQIVNESIGITGDVAVLLERTLGVPALFWTRAEADYQAFESKRKATANLGRYAAWANRFDEATLRRHGVISAGDDMPTKVDKILRLFRVATPDAFEQTWMRPRVSFRRSQAFAVAEQNTALWLRLVERSAEDMRVGTLSTRALRRTARTLPAMTNLSVPDGFIAARAALAEAGVALTFVREVPGTRVCAATWWLDADRPIIGLTERHRKPDTFWFNLVHEVGHIIQHPRRTTFLDLDTEKQSNNPAESEADAFAIETLVPGNARDRIAQAGSRQDLVLLAARLGIGVAIVAGQYAKLTNAWDVASPLRGKITDEDLAELEELVVGGLRLP
jgi:HTH-type transcriptional regulator / antitoxin HigA